MFNLSGRVAFVTDEVSEIDLNTNNLLAKSETKVVFKDINRGKEGRPSRDHKSLRFFPEFIH
jgi:hypothetical protein